MKKKVLAMVLTAVCAMGLMAGCGNSGNAATGTQNAATESGYKVGISQFAEHGSLDNCREGFLEGLKEEGIEEGKNLTVIRMHRPIPVRQARLLTALYLQRMI